MADLDLTQDLTANDLVRLDDDSFTEYVVHRVDDDVPDASWEVLLGRPLHARVRAALGRLIGEINTEANDNRRTMPPGEYARWSSGVSGYRAALSLRLRQYEAARDRYRKEERESSAGLVRLLTYAIADHRLACVAAGIEPEAHDRALWAALDRLVVHRDGKSLTLTQMLGEGYWPRTGAGTQAAAEAVAS